MSGQFTLVGPELDAVVAKDIAQIAREVHERTRPTSIVLLGSFGRGEGRIGPNGYVSDIEIAVVRPLPTSKLAELSRAWTQRLSTDVNLYYTPYLRFVAARSRIPRYRTDRPLLSTYDLRNGSQVIGGRDVISPLPPCRAHDIPLAEGLRLLGNRAAEVLSRKDDLVALDKLALACGDAWLLAERAYALQITDREAGVRARCPPGIALPYAAAVARRKGELREERGDLRRAVASAVGHLAEAIEGPDRGPPLSALLAGATCAGAHHSGFVRSPRLWDAICERKLRRARARIARPPRVLAEWAVGLAAISVVSGEPLPGVADDVAELVRAWRAIAA